MLSYFTLPLGPGQTLGRKTQASLAPGQAKGPSGKRSEQLIKNTELTPADPRSGRPRPRGFARAG